MEHKNIKPIAKEKDSNFTNNGSEKSVANTENFFGEGSRVIYNRDPKEFERKSREIEQNFDKIDNFIKEITIEKEATSSVKKTPWKRLGVRLVRKSVTPTGTEIAKEAELNLIEEEEPETQEEAENAQQEVVAGSNIEETLDSESPSRQVSSVPNNTDQSTTPTDQTPQSTPSASEVLPITSTANREESNSLRRTPLNNRRFGEVQFLINFDTVNELIDNVGSPERNNQIRGYLRGVEESFHREVDRLAFETPSYPPAWVIQNINNPVRLFRSNPIPRNLSLENLRLHNSIAAHHTSNFVSVINYLEQQRSNNLTVSEAPTNADDHLNSTTPSNIGEPTPERNNLSENLENLQTTNSSINQSQNTANLNQNQQSNTPQSNFQSQRTYNLGPANNSGSQNNSPREPNNPDQNQQGNPGSGDNDQNQGGRDNIEDALDSDDDDINIMDLNIQKLIRTAIQNLPAPTNSPQDLIRFLECAENEWNNFRGYLAGNENLSNLFMRSLTQRLHNPAYTIVNRAEPRDFDEFKKILIQNTNIIRPRNIIENQAFSTLQKEHESPLAFYYQIENLMEEFKLALEMEEHTAALKQQIYTMFSNELLKWIPSALAQPLAAAAKTKTFANFNEFKEFLQNEKTLEDRRMFIQQGPRPTIPGNPWTQPSTARPWETRNYAVVPTASAFTVTPEDQKRLRSRSKSPMNSPYRDGIIENEIVWTNDSSQSFPIWKYEDSSASYVKTPARLSSILSPPCNGYQRSRSLERSVPWNNKAISAEDLAKELENVRMLAESNSSSVRHINTKCAYLQKDLRKEMHQAIRQQFRQHRRSLSAGGPEDPRNRHNGWSRDSSKDRYNRDQSFNRGSFSRDSSTDRRSGTSFNWNKLSRDSSSERRNSNEYESAREKYSGYRSPFYGKKPNKGKQVLFGPTTYHYPQKERNDQYQRKESSPKFESSKDQNKETPRYYDPKTRKN